MALPTQSKEGQSTYFPPPQPQTQSTPNTSTGLGGSGGFGFDFNGRHYDNSGGGGAPQSTQVQSTQLGGTPPLPPPTPQSTPIKQSTPTNQAESQAQLAVARNEQTQSQSNLLPQSRPNQSTPFTNQQPNERFKPSNSAPGGFTGTVKQYDTTNPLQALEVGSQYFFGGNPVSVPSQSEPIQPSQTFNVQNRPQMSLSENLRTSYDWNSFFSNINLGGGFTEFISGIGSTPLSTLNYGVLNFGGPSLANVYLNQKTISGVVSSASKTSPLNPEVYAGHPDVQTFIGAAPFAVGAIPLGVGNQVITEVIPLRERATPIAYEEINTKIVNGQPIRYSDYTIYTEKQPPRISYETSLNKQMTGRAVENPKYLPSVVEYTKTPFKATANEPFTIVEFKSARVLKVSSVEGQSQRFDILSYNQLPESQKFLVQKLAEAKTGGTPVAADFNSISKIVSPRTEQLRFVSDIDVAKVMKTYKGKDFAEIKSYGKLGQSTSRYQAITEITPLKETDLYELTASRVVFLDVTKPRIYERPIRAQSSQLNVITIENKQPIFISGPPEKPRIINPYTAEKTPFSKTFQIQEQVQKSQTIYAPVKVPKAISTSKVISTPMKQTSVLNFASVSVYSGTGQYERTSGGLLPGQININQNKNIEVYRTDNSFINSFKFHSSSLEITKTITSPVEKPMTKTLSTEITKTIPKEITKTIQKPAQKLTSKQISKSISKTSSKIVTPTPRSSFHTTEKTPPLKLPRFNPSSSSFSDFFSVFVRRGGKFKPVGTNLQLKQALSLGEDITQKGLGQTFQIRTSSGQPVNFQTPRGYYKKQSKQGILFIEKPKTKINTPQEKFLLKFARSLKGGSRKRR